MKLKAAITATAPDELVRAFGSIEFASSFMGSVLHKTFGVETPALRPAEFYVQFPDRTIPAGSLGDLIDPWGVEVRLTGVSRNGRTPKVFHEALMLLDDLVAATAMGALPAGTKAQIFVVIMLDGDIELEPGSGRYGSVIESEARWVESVNS